MTDKSQPNFYTRMLEAKKRKKAALEAQQLRAEFQANPQAYIVPIVVKTDAEQKMDQAFSQLRQKLEENKKQDPIERSIQRIQEKLEGL